jgi:hypothetical protein
MFRKLFKQYNIKGIGTFINVLYLTAPMLGIVMYIINATTFYAVAFPYIHKYVSWLSLPIFLLFLILGVLVLLLVFYKFIYPSYFSFLNRQTYIHDNPIQKDLAKIKKNLGIEDDE